MQRNTTRLRERLKITLHKRSYISYIFVCRENAPSWHHRKYANTYLSCLCWSSIILTDIYLYNEYMYVKTLRMVNSNALLAQYYRKLCGKDDRVPYNCYREGLFCVAHRSKSFFFFNRKPHVLFLQVDRIDWNNIFYFLSFSFRSCNLFVRTSGWPALMKADRFVNNHEMPLMWNSRLLYYSKLLDLSPVVIFHGSLNRNVHFSCILS